MSWDCLEKKERGFLHGFPNVQLFVYVLRAICDVTSVKTSREVIVGDRISLEVETAVKIKLTNQQLRNIHVTNYKQYGDRRYAFSSQKIEKLFSRSSYLTKPVIMMEYEIVGPFIWYINREIKITESSITFWSINNKGSRNIPQHGHFLGCNSTFLDVYATYKGYL